MGNVSRTPHSPKRQCKAHNRSGVQCRNAARPGIQVCRIHGGLTPSLEPRVQRAIVREGLQKLVVPIDADDWEANPANSLAMEFRRTVAAIRYYDEKLASLQERDLVWGLASESHKGATEFPGVDSEYRAQINVYEQRRFAERGHLTDLHKLWVTAKLDVKRLEIEQRYVDMLESTMRQIITGLGKDPEDPEVRQIVRTSLLALPSAS